MATRRTHATDPALSTMIVDADPAAARRLQIFLDALPGLSVTCAVHSLPAAIRQAAASRPDVVFLDASMEDGQGLDVARHLDPHQAIVVVTDRADYALHAFQSGAIDYVLKPVDHSRLRETVRRLRRLFGQRATSPAPAADPSPPPGRTTERLSITDRLLLPGDRGPSGRAVELVPVSQVAWIESLQNYSIVQLEGNVRRRLKRSLAEWTTLLPQPEFARVDRSHVLQVQAIRTCDSPRRGVVLVHCHRVVRPLQLGRAAGDRLREALGRGSAG